MKNQQKNTSAVAVLLRNANGVETKRTDCQVVRTEGWKGPHAFERCVNVVRDLTESMTATNRNRHRFIFEILRKEAKPAENGAPPTCTQQSFRVQQDMAMTKCKERQILFSAPIVRATLEDWKTVMRRQMKFPFFKAGRHSGKDTQ